MPDIFNRRPLTVGNSFAADSAAITFAGQSLAPGSGLLVQNLGFQYQQPITRVYELGTQNTFYVAGRPQGQGNIGRILGPGTVVTDFYRVYGDVCKSKGNMINIWASAFCGDPCEPQNNSDAEVLRAGFAFLDGFGVLPGVRYCMTGVLLNSVGMTVAAQDMVLNETSAFMFIALEVCPANQISLCWPPTVCCNTDGVVLVGDGGNGQ